MQQSNLNRVLSSSMRLSFNRSLLRTNQIARRTEFIIEQQIVCGNVANQIQGFTIDYGKFMVIGVNVG